MGEPGEDRRATALRVDPSAGPLAVAWLWLEGCANAGSPPGLDDEIAAAEREVRERCERAALAADPVVAGVRALLRAGGIDPTRYRPSGEALARRVLHDRPLPRINPLVDVNNLISLVSRLPCGVYDRAAVRAPVVVRRGRDGECYPGIARPVRLAGCLLSADREGPFGSPIADSRRTLVSESTRSALALVYAPPGTPDEQLAAILRRYGELASRHLGATVAGSGIERA